MSDESISAPGWRPEAYCKFGSMQLLETVLNREQIKFSERVILTIGQVVIYQRFNDIRPKTDFYYPTPTPPPPPIIK